ncbi:MAG: hypothetical protein AB1631_08970 [Acidobacteriota bacterium]
MELKLVSSSTRNRKIIFAIVALFGLFSLFLVWAWPIYSFLSSYDRPPSIQFESERWKNKNLEESGHPIRIQMIDDLISSRMLDGMSKAEILKLLGEADNDGYFKDWDMVYWLGPERSPISIDSEWLVIRFDSEEKVFEYKTARD